MPWRAIVLLVGAVLWGSGVLRCGALTQQDELDFSTVDIRQLATHTYGTELFLLENRYRDQKTAYKFEDFFWTGSGDGPEEEEHHRSSGTASTIYKTKTIVTTMFIESPQTSYNETSKEITTPKCSRDCTTEQATTPADGEIKPSPTIKTEGTEGPGDREFGEDFFDTDRQFWLVTVLKSDGKDPVIIDLKNSLEKLYKIAFQRQQERHLGITNHRIKRAPIEGPVNVYIHEMNRTKMNGDKKIEVLYHVSVAGKPVSAITAAKDMHLISDEEVQKELGYPFIIKAEPYLKPSEPQGLSSARSTWMFIGVSIVGLIIFLLVLAFLILGCTKKKKVSTPTSLQGIENRQHIFERGAGHESKGYTEDENKRTSPTYINYKNENSAMTKSVAVVARPGSSISSMSSSSSSLDISPLMNLKKHHRSPPKKHNRPRAALNKTAPMSFRRMPPEVFDSDGSSSRKESPEATHVGNYDPGVVSPKSYLSMPSVKSFPRGNMPVPLNKVLEPVSILHLDMLDDHPQYGEGHFKDTSGTGLVRHGSLGAVEDPGVIGPIVWNAHCQKLQHGVSVDEGMHDMTGTHNVSKMRKRFHDLLDDTFSLFGSRKGSPVDKYGPEAYSHNVPIEVKSHSAVNTRSDDLKAPTPKPRPKTSDLRKVDHQATASGPKGVSVDEGMHDMTGTHNVSKMRKRFHDLLDDTFSLFGSRKGSPVDKYGPEAYSHNVPIEVKSHSAVNTRSDDLKAPTPKPRPKTSDLRKVDHQATASGPKGAWSSKAPSPLVRPLSAGVINPYPRINVDHILAEGRFRENDPAVPLIAAIKSEIERVSIPGSTTDLNH